MPLSRIAKSRPISLFRQFLDAEASGGLVLMTVAFLALVIANSPVSDDYNHILHASIGPMSVQHWINDGLMTIFFLLVGLEIKREMIDGQLATWSRRMLPGIAAIGGMIVPALIYVAFNLGHPENLRGWAIPSATDIAFALGVLSLLGNRVPTSLKIFLTALAIIDDLGAVIIIVVFYTSGLSWAYLAGAAAVTGMLWLLNKRGVLTLIPYILLGAVLWFFTLKSGVHATLAGVILALTIPLRMKPGHIDDLTHSPLHRLEHYLHKVVPFIIIPIFGFANAGVTFMGLSGDVWTAPLTLGVGAGLALGKLIGVFGFAWLAIRGGLADLPVRATWGQLLGVCLLCGIGFTMSLFISMLAFVPYPDLIAEAKIGILAGSFFAALAGYLVLRIAPMWEKRAQ